MSKQSQKDKPYQREPPMPTQWTDDPDTFHYQLMDGRVILDEGVSLKMQIIHDRQPERSCQEDNTGYSWNEIGMADLFAECYIEDARYCPDNGSWYVYDGTAWKKDKNAIYVAAKIKEFTQLLSLYCVEIENEEVRTAYTKFVAKLGDRRLRERICKDAVDRMPIRREEFDANPYLINCQNGTFDLDTMLFREHSWRDFLTYKTNFSYGMSGLDDYRCPRWEQFISEICQGDKDKAEYLQKALGYSMLGLANEECMFILHGRTTRNGKSTLLNTIQHMLGDYAGVVRVALICHGRGSADANAATPELAGTKGKRFITMAESDAAGKLDEGAIKQLTGGEEISARELYEKSFHFVPQFTLWLSCNDLPAVTDRSLFASDRLRVIEFNRHFSAAEQDKTLKQYFESDEAMRGIFTWLLAGWFKYRGHGLTMPESMQKVVAKYQRDNDLVLQFLEETYKQDLTGRVKEKNCYEMYKMWCRKNGYFTMKVKKFKAELMTHPEWVFDEVKSSGYYYYLGISQI